MSRGLLIGLGCGFMAGAVLAFAAIPRIAVAQGPTATTGLYQIQIATGAPEPGTSTIWRVNTATGALEFCSYVNVTLPGAQHVVCRGNSSPK